MKFFALPNLASHNVEEVDPTTSTLKAPLHRTKEERREWQSALTTKHLFYSACEGFTPSVRITKENSPYRLHGLVCDYDSKVSDAEVGGMGKRAAAGLLPIWKSCTFSGGARLVFEFEAPVYVDNHDLAERFLKEVKKELKLDCLLPGLDESSFDLKQYFELGTDWRRLPDAKPIPSDILELLFYRAAGKKVIRGEGPEIPIEVVADEVEKRWPGRIDGEFVVGARTPLFWIDDGIDRVGAQVGDYGMICYSTRAHKGFLHWGEILGRDFVRDYEASRIGVAADGIWFDGDHYWRKGDDGRWNCRSKADQIMWLKGQGFRGTTRQRETISDAEKVLLAIQASRTVDAAVSIALDSRELVVEHGCRFLNVSIKKAMQPAENGAEAEFPWLHTFFQNVFDKTQRDYLFAWWKRFYRGAIARNLEQGQAVIIAGEAGRGKTLLSRVIIGSSVGGFADASRYLMGESRFNKECGENALWVVDDSKSCGSRKQHRAFTEAIKAQISNPQGPCEPKFKDSLTLSWKGRIIITTNVDPDSLAIIPDLGPTVRDKLMLFRFNDDYQPEFKPSREMEATIAKELPFFLASLLKWKEPASVLDKNPRYGIKSYHHPELEKASIMASPAHGVSEALDILRENYCEAGTAADKQKKEIRASATNLYRMLNQVDGLSYLLRFYSENTFGRALQTAIRQGYTPLSSKDTKRGTLYTLVLRDEDVPSPAPNNNGKHNVAGS